MGNPISREVARKIDEAVDLATVELETAVGVLADGRSAALMRTKLDEARMWAFEAVRRGTTLSE